MMNYLNNQINPDCHNNNKNNKDIKINNCINNKQCPDIAEPVWF